MQDGYHVYIRCISKIGISNRLSNLSSSIMIYHLAYFKIYMIIVLPTPTSLPVFVFVPRSENMVAAVGQCALLNVLYLYN